MAGPGVAIGAPARDLCDKVRAALEQLAEAYLYAQDARADAWDFAVELPSLSALGLTPSDLRWLVLKGYVEHAREVTQPGENGRAFRPTGNLTFTKHTCFVLTEAGAALALRACTIGPANSKRVLFQATRDGNGRDSGTVPIFPQRKWDCPPPEPKWDAQLRELRLGGELVKQYKLPSPNQETVLIAFEEEGWPISIDDPLSPQPEQDPKRRLHDTIKSLNRNQKPRLLRFLGNGTGQGVRWELIR